MAVPSVLWGHIQPSPLCREGRRVNLCGSDNTTSVQLLSSSFGVQDLLQVQVGGLRAEVGQSSVCQGEGATNCKKVCICSVFVLPPISLWVYYTLMTSAMADQIISDSSPSQPSLSFAPWGNRIQQNVL